MTTIVYHRKSFKTKPVMKQEYKELVDFCDGLLIDEERKDKEIIELKKQNLKLIQAVEILNQNLKHDKNEENEEAYREGRKNFMEDMITEFPEKKDKIIELYEL